MYGYRPGIAVIATPYERSEQDYLQKSREKRNVKVDDAQEGLFPMSPFDSTSSLSWKLCAVLLGLLIIIFFTGIAVWIAWVRWNSGYNWGDEGPLGPDPSPAVCYKCNNYEQILEGRQLSSPSDVKRSESGGIQVSGAIGVGVDVGNQKQILCREFVNRTALAATRSLSKDNCGDSLYDGCFKMITKSYRLTPNLGRERLIVTVVTRNCAELPKGMSLGCYRSFGGAAIERVICYCKGNYCNSATSEAGFISLGLLLSLFNLCKSRNQFAFSNK
ncbi:hypothetical protein Aperf_G00000066115 [Anoplocephala perfoliata]